MSERRGGFAATVRNVLVPVAMAVAAGTLGVVVATRPAAAASTEEAGYTCKDTDKCHDGSAKCCDDTTFDHCTTQCPICTGTGCEDES